MFDDYLQHSLDFRFLSVHRLLNICIIMSLKKFFLLGLGTTLSLLPTMPASALIWNSTDSNYTSFNSQFTMNALLDSGASDGDQIGGLYNPDGQGFAFSEQYPVKQSLNNGFWGDWSQPTAEVFVNAGDTATLEIEYASNNPAITAFGFYLQPKDINTYLISASVNDGVASLVQSVNGNNGAKYFGFYASNGDRINKISIVAPSGALGFATAQYSFSNSSVSSVSSVAVPWEISPTWGIFVGLSSWFSLTWLRRKAVLKIKSR